MARWINKFTGKIIDGGSEFGRLMENQGWTELKLPDTEPLPTPEKKVPKKRRTRTKK